MSTAAGGFRARGLSKRYGATQALAAIDLAARPGERLALVGHNGAGKTTLLRLVLGLTRPDSGEILTCGTVPGSIRARRNCAWLPENAAFHPALTGVEQIRLCARLKGVPARSALESLDRVGLNGAAARRIGTYSRGMRQRLVLAQALLGTPGLVLLDEPTGGLDPDSRRAFYRLAGELAEGGAAVVYSSHALGEVESNADRVAIFHHGSVVANAPIPELRTASGLPSRIRARLRADAPDDLHARLGGTRRRDGSVDILCPPGAAQQRLASLFACGPDLEEVSLAPPSLDAVCRFHVRQAGAR